MPVFLGLGYCITVHFPRNQEHETLAELRPFLLNVFVGFAPVRPIVAIAKLDHIRKSLYLNKMMMSWRQNDIFHTN